MTTVRARHFQLALALRLGCELPELGAVAGVARLRDHVGDAWGRMTHTDSIQASAGRGTGTGCGYFGTTRARGHMVAYT